MVWNVFQSLSDESYEQVIDLLERDRWPVCSYDYDEHELSMDEQHIVKDLHMQFSLKKMRLVEQGYNVIRVPDPIYPYMLKWFANANGHLIHDVVEEKYYWGTRNHHTFLKFKMRFVSREFDEWEKLDLLRMYDWIKFDLPAKGTSRCDILDWCHNNCKGDYYIEQYTNNTLPCYFETKTDAVTLRMVRAVKEQEKFEQKKIKRRI